MPGIEGFARGPYTRAASNFVGAISGERAGVFVQDSFTGRMLRSELLAPLASNQNLPAIARAEAMAAVNNPGRLSALARSLAGGFRLSPLLRFLGPIGFLLALLDLLARLSDDRTGDMMNKLGGGFSSTCPGFAEAIFSTSNCPPGTMANTLDQIGKVRRTSIGGNSYVEGFTYVSNVRPSGTPGIMFGDRVSGQTRTVNYGIALPTGDQFARDSKWNGNADPNAWPKPRSHPSIDPMGGPRPRQGNAPLPWAIPHGWLPYRRPNPNASPTEQSNWGPRVRTRARSHPRPNATPLPGTSGPPVIIVYPPGVIAPDTWLPPRKGEKEKKPNWAKAGVNKIVGAVTEGLDALDALYNSLPGKLRRRERAKRHGKDPSVQGKLQLLFQHFGKVDWNEAFLNFLENEIKDTAIARVKRGVNRNQYGVRGGGPSSIPSHGNPLSGVNNPYGLGQ